MLTLQFVPYHEVETLDSSQKINKLLSIVKDDKIILLQGRLTNTEETKLIERTMSQVNSNFKGVEICTIYPQKVNKNIKEKIKNEMIKMLLGNREGLTIIGPATIVKEIKRDPNKIQLLITEAKKTRRKK